jgi:hypothetical protein
MNQKHIRTLQKAVNETLDNAEVDWLKIPVDGKLGPLTRKHARAAGSWQGLSREHLIEIGEGHIHPGKFVWDVLTHHEPMSREMKHRHQQRLHHFKELRYHHKHPPQIEGLVEYDGHQLPGWIAEINKEARASGEWKGGVISGVRSPEYSEHLCIIMCGMPTCPGRCGGRFTNHACPPSGKGVKYEGAEDVTDPAGLQSFCRKHNKPLHGNGEVLPADLNHFSHEGN